MRCHWIWRYIGLGCPPVSVSSWKERTPLESFRGAGSGWRFRLGLLAMNLGLFGCTQSEPAHSPEPASGTWWVTADLALGPRAEGCLAAGSLAARLAVMLHHEPHSRWIDAGNLLGADQDPSGLRLTAQLVRTLHAGALNLGPAELSRGPEALRTLQREGALPLVSANVAPRGDGTPTVARSFVRSVGGLRMAITGAVLSERVGHRGYSTWEHGPAIANEVSAMAAVQMDGLLVLAQMDRQAARELAREVPQIDLLLYTEPYPRAERVRSVIVIPVRHPERQVSVLRLHLARPAGRPASEWVTQSSALEVSFEWKDLVQVPAEHPAVQETLQAAAPACARLP